MCWAGTAGEVSEKPMTPLECDCTAADVCPQGRVGQMARCKVIKREERMTRDKAIKL